MEVDGDQQEGVGGQVAGLLGGWLPWQAQLGHRLSQGCQPAPRAAARQHSWPAGQGPAESTAAYFNSRPNRRPIDHPLLTYLLKTLRK